MIANLKKSIKAQGLEVDDEGNITKDEKIDPEKIKEDAIKAARKDAFDQYKNSKLAQVKDEESRKVVEYYFDKLSAGEELDHAKIDTFIEKAIGLANTDEGNSIEITNGAPPNIKDDGKKDDYAETEAGESAGKALNLKSFQPEAKEEAKKKEEENKD